MVWKTVVALLIVLNLTSAEPGQAAFDWAGLNGQVASLFRQGLNAEGQNTLKAGIQAARQAGEIGPELAGALNDLGTLYQDSDRFLDAERAYKESVVRWRRIGGNPKLGVALANLGGLRLLQGKPSEAEHLYLEAERVLLAGYGPNHPELAPVFNGLANVYSETGRFEHARHNSERAVALLETAEDQPQLGIALFLLAKVQWKQNREAAAEPLLRRAIDVWRTSLGPQHPTYASGLTCLALLLSGKDPRESERLFRDALAVIESALGPSHLFTGQIFVLYASHLERLGRKAEAKELRQRGNAIVARQSRENRLGHTIDIRNLR